MLRLPYAGVWALFMGVVGLFVLTLIQNVLTHGTLTWTVLATAAGTTLWWSMLISLMLWLHHAFNMRLQRDRNSSM